MQSSRWYDKDPTVSLAISLLRNSSEKNQIQAANFLLEQFSEHGISVESAKNKSFLLFNRRWYDLNKELHESIETYRKLSPEIQKLLAVQLINYLCSLEESKNMDIV
jgi:hypothetical protein